MSWLWLESLFGVPEFGAYFSPKYRKDAAILCLQAKTCLATASMYIMAVSYSTSVDRVSVLCLLWLNGYLRSL